MGFLFPVVDSGDFINNGQNSAWYQTGDIEIEAVIRLEKSNAQGPVFSMSDADGSTLNANANILSSLEISSTQRLSYRHEYGTGSAYYNGGSVATVLPIGMWTRVKITRVGTLLTFFINGQNVYSANFTNGPYAGTVPQQKLWIGRIYLGLNASYDYGRGFSIAYVRYKGPTGSVLYTLGQDPGGAPGAIAPEIGFAGPFSFIPGAFARPAQTQKADMELDGYEGLFVRPSQRANGTTYEIPEGTGGGGDSEPIQTPRAYPLEASWKKANPSQFS